MGILEIFNLTSKDDEIINPFTNKPVGDYSEPLTMLSEIRKMLSEQPPEQEDIFHDSGCEPYYEFKVSNVTFPDSHGTEINMGDFVIRVVKLKEIKNSFLVIGNMEVVDDISKTISELNNIPDHDIRIRKGMVNQIVTFNESISIHGAYKYIKSDIRNILKTTYTAPTYNINIDSINDWRLKDDIVELCVMRSSLNYKMSLVPFKVLEISPGKIYQLIEIEDDKAVNKGNGRTIIVSDTSGLFDIDNAIQLVLSNRRTIINHKNNNTQTFIGKIKKRESNEFIEHEFKYVVHPIENIKPDQKTMFDTLLKSIVKVNKANTWEINVAKGFKIEVESDSKLKGRMVTKVDIIHALYFASTQWYNTDSLLNLSQPVVLTVGDNKYRFKLKVVENINDWFTGDFFPLFRFFYY